MDEYRDDYDIEDEPLFLMYVSNRDTPSKRIISTLYQNGNLTDQVKLIDVDQARQVGALPSFLEGVPTLVYYQDDGTYTCIQGYNDIEPWLESYINDRRQEMIEDGEVGKNARLLPANAASGSKWTNIHDKKKIKFDPSKFDWDFARHNPKKAQEMLGTQCGRDPKKTKHEMMSMLRDYEKQRDMQNRKYGFDDIKQRSEMERRQKDPSFRPARKRAPR